MEQERKIIVGKITGPHGLRGLVRLRSFTEDPMSIVNYPVMDAEGKPRRITIKTAMAEEFIAELEGVNNREQAEAARGLQLFVLRDQLPALGQREYYLADLIGLRADDAAGQGYGSILAVHDFGAGTLLEIKLPDGRTAMLPFRDAFVPTVDVQAGFVVIAPPEDWLSNTAKSEDKSAEHSA
jgi:16S rRNA processing protein RimM